MTLILENGSGVSGANAYVDADYVTAYLTDRGRQTENNWDTASAAVQAGLCVLATDYVEARFRQLFRGSKYWSDISTARATWTPTAQPLDTETVTLGSVVYTFKTSPSGANDVEIGATLSESIDNLVTAMGDNADATASAFTDDTLLAVATAPGTPGNAVATTTTVTGATWNFATLTGGSDIVRPQPLSFPRSGLYDRDGVAILGMPVRLKYATAEYTVRARGSTLAPDPELDDRGGLVSKFREKVGPIDTAIEYVPGTAGSGSLPAYPAADRLLMEFTRPAGVVR